MAYLITRYSLAYGKCFRDRFNILPVVNMKNVRTGDNSQVNLTAQFVNIVDTMNTYDKLNDIGMLDDSDAELLAKDMIKKDVLMGYVDSKDKKKAEESSFFDMINRLNSNDDDDMYY